MSPAERVNEGGHEGKNQIVLYAVTAPHGGLSFRNWKHRLFALVPGVAEDSSAPKP